MKKGLLKVNDFEIFESIRTTGGGSVLTGVHNSLNPIMVSDGCKDDIEILVVEGDIGEKKCRFINGYGSQECADVDKRIKFFSHLEEEIIKAKLQGALICIELDANAKLGPDVVENDPHAISPNGELLLGLLKRNNLIVCNGSAFCTGVLTRTRVTVNGTEKSIIDFLIVCEELFSYAIEIIVDEEKKYSVESIVKSGSRAKVTKTDHNMLIGRFNLKVIQKSSERRKEMFKYNDVEGMRKFKELTSKDILSKCFDEKDIIKASEKWFKQLNNILHRSFKKTRIGNRKKPNNEAVNILKTKHQLKNKLDEVEIDLKSEAKNNPTELVKQKHELEDKIEEIEITLADINAEKHAALITEHFDELTGDDGEFSILKMWNLRKKLSSHNAEVPMAMQDEAGNLITGKMGLKNLYQTTYTNRLSHKPIQEGWEEIQDMKENLFRERLQFSSEMKSDDWDISQIKKVCSKLKSGKARDRDDLVYELFNPQLCGDDLTLSLTKMLNGIKKNLEIPQFLEKVAITSLYKLKGVKSDFKNQRGVFNVSKVRTILDKVLYSDVYPIIDKELSYSNIGGRKGRNIRDHLFVVYSVINDVINGSSPPVDIQSIDIHKCFDEMWYAETHNDMYDVKVQDDKFALIAKMDQKANVIVKTPCGPTEEFTLEEIVMQGSVFGPIKSTIQIDTLGRDCQTHNQGMFKYKNVLSITPLALIDDCLGFSTCSTDSVEMNAILNSKIISKKLRLSADKCHHLHISKKPTSCFNNLKAGSLDMKKSTVCSYLGDILSSSGSIDATIESRRQKGIGLCSQIAGMVDGLSLRHYYFKISFLMREAMLLNGMLTNLEVWHPINNQQIEVLENVDLMLIRKLLKGHSKTPKEAFFLDTGLLPIRYLAIKRRLMYLHNILTKPKSELINKVYEVQKAVFTNKDWFNIVKENRSKLGILLTDEQISIMSKEKYKSIVDKAVKSAALEYLNKLAAKSDSSKSRMLAKSKLIRENYLDDKRFSRSEIELLFALRTNMVPGIKKNFSSQYGNDISCDLCSNHVDSQENLLSCVKLTSQVSIPCDVTYADIYKNTDKQLRIVKIIKKLLRARELLKCE